MSAPGCEQLRSRLEALPVMRVAAPGYEGLFISLDDLRAALVADETRSALRGLRVMAGLAEPAPGLAEPPTAPQRISAAEQSLDSSQRGDFAHYLLGSLGALVDSDQLDEAIERALIFAGGA